MLYQWLTLRAVISQKWMLYLWTSQQKKELGHRGHLTHVMTRSRISPRLLADKRCHTWSMPSQSRQSITTLESQRQPKQGTLEEEACCCIRIDISRDCLLHEVISYTACRKSPTINMTLSVLHAFNIIHCTYPWHNALQIPNLDKTHSCCRPPDPTGC
jgi:hypothetical protein